MSSPSSSAQQARQALGLRLREIRVNAWLTGRQLGALMGRHSAKISRIEHGSAAPAPRDIREWCRHTGADDQVPDLLASLHAAEGMWVEWRRMERSGLRHAQESIRPLYDRTRQFRAYSPNLVPGIVQTPAYTTAVLNAIARRRRELGEIIRRRVTGFESVLKGGATGQASQGPRGRDRAASPPSSLGLTESHPESSLTMTASDGACLAMISAMAAVSALLTVTSTMPASPNREGFSDNANRSRGTV